MNYPFESAVAKPVFDKTRLFIMVSPPNEQNPEPPEDRYWEPGKNIVIAGLGELAHEQTFWTGPSGAHANELFLSEDGANGALLLWPADGGPSPWAVSKDAVQKSMELVQRNGRNDRMILAFHMTDDGSTAHMGPIQSLREICEATGIHEPADESAPTGQDGGDAD